MAKLNAEQLRKALADFDFPAIFIDCLGWGNPTAPFHRPRPEELDDLAFTFQSVAQMAHAQVFLVWPSQVGTAPFLRKAQDKIAEFLATQSAENVCIFLDRSPSVPEARPTQAVWIWRRRKDNKWVSRPHIYSAGQPGDLFIAKIRNLHFDLSQEGEVDIMRVAEQLRKGLDIEQVTKKFYKDYQERFADFAQYIEGFEKEDERRWYASVLLNRLMFIYFLQQKGFLDKGDRSYLHTKLRQVQREHGPDQYYSFFLQKLFFEGFACPEGKRPDETNALLGKIRYLNGGLFLPHKFERKDVYDIRIPDAAFELLLAEDTHPKGLFARYSWTLNDVPGEPDNEINPDVLGYIFEKYINQKEFGAYYTRPEITEYLCEQTVYKLVLDKLAERGYTFEEMGDLLQRLDAPILKLLILGREAILPSISLLDPACGSGAFLVAAMKVLINLYSAIYGKIPFLADNDLHAYRAAIDKDHPSLPYYIKKRIIAHNLFGVDIMEEATEIARLRLFLALVSSAQKVSELEPLPNIDFNIQCGNSLIGLLGVDGAAFNIQTHKKGKPTVQRIHHAPVQANAFSQTAVQTSLLDARGGMIKMGEDPNAGWKNYEQLVQEMEALKKRFREADGEEAKRLKADILIAKNEANDTLNLMLLAKFNELGIKYERQTWDEAKGKEGKPSKEPLTIDHIRDLAPFHWGYEFSEVFRKGGFDAIITNPPWEVLQTDEKEWFGKLDNKIKKKKLRIEDWKEQMTGLMEDPEVQESWLAYSSQFPHQSAWYKKSGDYMGMLSGKLNLFGLFTVRCYQLLRPAGYYGTVIPSGIYTDEGYKNLRKHLFENTKITGLFCFENRKEIFENVHRSFKFIVLSFSKGGITESFPAAFMRHDTKELERFPKQGAMILNVDFIKKSSPESWSVMELKDITSLAVAEKLLRFPLLGGRESKWNIKLSTDFNMTTDSYLFKNSASSGSVILYEGKMFYQFNHAYSEPKYWVNEKEAAKAAGVKVGEGDYARYKLAFRDIASSTNERSFIAAILPKRTFKGNKAPYIADSSNLSNYELLFLLAFWNSYPTDWHLRQRVSSTINFFYVYQTPVPRIPIDSVEARAIISVSSKLTCTTPEFAELWEEVMGTPWTPACGATDPAERNELRAELDARVAHLYGLTEEEFAYILTTFPLVEQAQKDRVLAWFKQLA